MSVDSAEDISSACFAADALADSICLRVFLNSIR